VCSGRERYQLQVRTSLSLTQPADGAGIWRINGAESLLHLGGRT